MSNKETKIKKQQPRWVVLSWLLLLLACPIVLWILPAGFFDNGTSICPSKFFFNIECFGCGMTRAVMHLHHLDFDDAVYYNRGSFIIYPALVVLWFIWVRNCLKSLSSMIPQRKIA